MMKKTASKLFAIALTLAMTLGCTSTVFATGQQTPDPNNLLIDEDAKGSITLTKYDSSTTTGEGENLKGDKVEGAEFSAYQIVSYSNGKYTVKSDYTGIIKLDDVVYSDENATEGGSFSYGKTEELEEKIIALQDEIRKSSIEEDAKATTNEKGVAVLNIEKDPDDTKDHHLGIYLVVETVVPPVPDKDDPSKEDPSKGYTISTQAFLVTVPEWNNTAGEWNYNVTAYPKDEKITSDKKMVDDESNNGTTSDSYSIGDTIHYQVEADIPDYGDSLNLDENGNSMTVTEELLKRGEYDKYNALQVEFTDTLSKGLTLQLDKVDNLKVEILGGETPTALTGAIKTSDSDFKLKEYDENGQLQTGEGYYDFLVEKEETKDSSDVVTETKMTVTISWSSLDEYQGKKIRLTYDARLNENAVIEDANTNDVKFDFSHDPHHDTKDARTEINPPKTETYTYQLDLEKLLNGKAPGENEKENVKKVTFELKEVEVDKDNKESTTTLYVTKEDEGVYTIRTDAKDKDEDKNITQSISPDENGKLSIKGFAAGTYYLEETKSADGYTLLADQIKIKVEEVKDSKEKVTGTVIAYIPGGNGTEDTYLTDKNGNSNGIFELTVNNVRKQFNLPKTGGAGLWMFTIAGGILMALAIIFFHTLRARKRKGI